MFAAHQFRQVRISLSVRAIEADLVDTQVGMRAIRQTHRAGCTGNLFHGDCMCKVAKTRAAPALGHCDTEQSLLAQFGPQVARKLVAPVELRGTRCNALGGKAPHLGANFLEALIEPEITIDGSHRLAFPLSTIV
jgi:hypothetical protein